MKKHLLDSRKLFVLSCIYVSIANAAFAADAESVQQLDEMVIKSDKPERRFVAAFLAEQIRTTAADELLMETLEDEELQVVYQGVMNFEQREPPKSIEDRLFERLEKLQDRFQKKNMRLKPMVWPFTNFTVGSANLARALVNSLGDRPVDRLVPYMKAMDPNLRKLVVDRIAEKKTWDPRTRDALFHLAGDPSPGVREAALKTIADCNASSDEIGLLESMLTRKAPDLRRGIISLLVKQKDAEALASASRCAGPV